MERIIHSLGYYHAKAKNIIAASHALLSEFNGKVPQTMEELLTIPGVGRKTANIVLYHALGKNVGIAVDTHVRRLAQRIGFSSTDNVAVIERDLMALFPQDLWGDLTDVLIAHGRRCCDAKKPLCGDCVITQVLPVFQDFGKTGLIILFVLISNKHPNYRERDKTDQCTDGNGKDPGPDDSPCHTPFYRAGTHRRTHSHDGGTDDMRCADRDPCN